MRLVAYNIQNGGVGRADPLAEVLIAQRADVVVLVQSDAPEVVDRLAGRLTMDAVTGQGTGHAVAVLARPAIVSAVNHAATGGAVRGLLRVTVGPDEAVVLACDAAAGQTAALLAASADLRAAGRWHVLAGDIADAEGLAAAGYVNAHAGLRLPPVGDGPSRGVSAIWAWGVRSASAWVERDRLATFASDHYPVGAALAL